MDRQVFQTDSRSRWVRVKISIALILTLVCLFISVMVVSFLIDRIPNMPFKEEYSSVIMARKPYMKSNRLSKEYSGFRKYFNREHKLHSNYAKWDQARNLKIRRYNGNTGRYLTEWDSRPSGIRAAFYVSWDPMSFASLKTALGSLNLVIPEWYFINPATASVETHIDAKGYQLLKHSGIPVMPMLSNAWHGSFNAKGIGRILHDRVLRAQLVSSMLSACMKHGFVGINIDIEDLDETNNDAFTAFVKELSLAFHDHGLLVTQDIAPGNEDYDVKELAKYNDYLLLMAYDEHNVLSDAGPVSSQQWIDRTVGLIAEQVPPEKVILGLAAYGYDWNEKADNNQSIGFNDAMSVADDTHSQIDFDEDTYSLGYAYKDNSGQLHQVFFNDAATNFNTMRFGSEYRLAGFGVWRLGSEDRRLWSFYNKDLTRTGAARLRVGDLEVLHGSRYANYLGEGEVMDIINTPHDGNAHIDMDNENLLIARETYTKIPTSYDLRKYGSCGKKDLLLTFDDGPDRQWTPAILKTLRHYGVHAAFFMVGLQMERNLPVVRDVFEEGHLIGNHTFTHRNVATNTPQRTYMELRLTRMLIETCTGHSTILFRAPYNADSDPSGSEELIPLAEARKQNFINVGEAVDPNDWQPGVTADEIFRRVVKSVEHGEGHIILLHDAGGDTRKATVDALPRIISYFQQHGYRFITLEQYLGESKTDL
ncbi:MAG: glycosyl hydrolase family 18 protein, partial [Prevotella sp.]|nr:glycosyl hydrolase family 18 protein [Prevotella sp.]